MANSSDTLAQKPFNVQDKEDSKHTKGQTIAFGRTYVLYCLFTHPVFLSLLVLLAAHVVGDCRDPDAVGRLPVDHVELEPGVPLLLPGQQGVLRAPRRVGRVAVLQEFVEQLVLDGAAVVGAEEGLLY